MLKRKFNAVAVTCGLLLATFSVAGVAQERITGKVMSTKVTACSAVADKPGTCEGTLVLDSNGRQVTVKVTRDTTLKRGDEKVFLFQLQGAVIVTSYPEKDVAQSIVAKN